MCADGKESIRPTELDQINIQIRKLTEEWFSVSKEVDRQIAIAEDLAMRIHDLQQKKHEIESH